MEFGGTRFEDDMQRLRASRTSDARAIADNFAFEEHVSDERRADFLAHDPSADGLREAAADYFWESVQGAERGHLPSTFQPMNEAALLAASVEGNQKIVRIEGLDNITAEAIPDFAALRDTVAGPRDAGLIGPVMRWLNHFPGERPAYAAFRSEVNAELCRPDWLRLVTARLGLGHCWPMNRDETKLFALMEYTAEEVFNQARVARPFAVPTVLEARNSTFFHPAPRASGAGYAADLDPAAGRDVAREILHIRLAYRAEHLVRVGSLTGPMPLQRLSAIRDTHLAKVRARASRPDFGAYMAGEVDE